MNDWDFSPPPPAELGDHDVRLAGDHLAGKRVALMISGGIAAMKTPLLARALRKEGAEVQAFVSREALRYVTVDALEWSTHRKVVVELSPDAEHLSDAAPFDAYLLPQATYNTINKMAHGIADGTLTATLAAALGRLERGLCAVLVAPTMHGNMHNSILTASLAPAARHGGADRAAARGLRQTQHAGRPGAGRRGLPRHLEVAARRQEDPGDRRADPGADRRGAPDRHPLHRPDGVAIATELYLRGADAPCTAPAATCRPPTCRTGSPRPTPTTARRCARSSPAATTAPGSSPRRSPTTSPNIRRPARSPAAARTSPSSSRRPPRSSSRCGAIIRSCRWSPSNTRKGLSHEQLMAIAARPPRVLPGGGHQPRRGDPARPR